MVLLVSSDQLFAKTMFKTGLALIKDFDDCEIDKMKREHHHWMRFKYDLMLQTFHDNDSIQDQIHRDYKAY